MGYDDPPCGDSELERRGRIPMRNRSQQEQFTLLYFRSGETVTMLDGSGYCFCQREAKWGAGLPGRNDDEILDRVTGTKTCAQGGWCGMELRQPNTCGGESAARIRLDSSTFTAIFGNGSMMDGSQPTTGSFQEKPAFNPKRPIFRRFPAARDPGAALGTAPRPTAGPRVATPSTRRIVSTGASGFRVSLVVVAAKKGKTTRPSRNAQRPWIPEADGAGRRNDCQ